VGLVRTAGRLAGRLESLARLRGRLVPPLHLRWRYYGTARPAAFAGYAAAATVELAARGLEPDHRVLDVGCGIGPLAAGLAPYLAGGRYDGFDVHAEAVAWCARVITPRHPHFRFRHADVANTVYNPGGSVPAAEYRFPYPDAAFDFAFLGSVCTHLRPADAAHYLREVGRVLRPGGRAVVSFYLLTPESARGVEAGTSFLPFLHPHGPGGSRVIDPANPERAIAHREDAARSWCAAAGLWVEGPVRYGGWWDGTAHGQDVVTAVRG